VGNLYIRLFPRRGTTSCPDPTQAQVPFTFPPASLQLHKFEELKRSCSAAAAWGCKCGRGTELPFLQQVQFKLMYAYA